VLSFACLHELADQFGLELQGVPFPVGHQQVEQDWASPILLYHQELAGRPLIRYQAIINLIASTTPTRGLTARAARQEHGYPARRSRTTKELAAFKCHSGKRP